MITKMNDYSSQVILSLLKKKGFELGPGLNDVQLHEVESAFKAKIPDSYRGLLKAGVPLGEGFPDWSNPQKVAEETQKTLQDIFKFDIQNNEYWIEEFGVKPNTNKLATVRALEVISTWQPLFPVYGHRFITSRPIDKAPVISIYQPTDAIIYGANLHEYFLNEFDNEHEFYVSEIQHEIPDWGRALVASGPAQGHRNEP